MRTAAVNLLATLHMYLGAQLRMFFEDEKPALLQQIDAAFEQVLMLLWGVCRSIIFPTVSFLVTILSLLPSQVAGEAAPVPTRGPNVGGDEPEEASGGGGGAGGGGAPVSLADLMPKVDVSGQIKPDLIKDLGDKNWKVRGEALQRVSQ